MAKQRKKITQIVRVPKPKKDGTPRKVSLKSLANLTPFEPGQPPQGAARIAGIEGVAWYNSLQDKPEAELQAIVDSPKESTHKRAIAARWLETLKSRDTLEIIHSRTHRRPLNDDKLEVAGEIAVVLRREPIP